MTHSTVQVKVFCCVCVCVCVCVCETGDEWHRLTWRAPQVSASLTPSLTHTHTHTHTHTLLICVGVQSDDLSVMEVKHCVTLLVRVNDVLGASVGGTLRADWMMDDEDLPSCL